MMTERLATEDFKAISTKSPSHLLMIRYSEFGRNVPLEKIIAPVVIAIPITIRFLPYREFTFPLDKSRLFQFATYCGLTVDQSACWVSRLQSKSCSLNADGGAHAAA
jgi:hypothetical protein